MRRADLRARDNAVDHAHEIERDGRDDRPRLEGGFRVRDTSGAELAVGEDEGLLLAAWWRSRR